MGTLQQDNRLTITAVLVTNFNFYTMTRNKIFNKGFEGSNKHFEFAILILWEHYCRKHFDDIIW